MENKQKHLEFIQAVITRMAGNLFFLKGWGITLAVGTLALLSSKDIDTRLTLIALLPMLAFWILDGYFLSQERQYRALYKEVSKKQEVDIDFSMDASKFNVEDNTWLNSTFSKIPGIFYGICLLMIIIISCWSYESKKPNSGYLNNFYEPLPRDQIYRSCDRVDIR